MTSNFLKYTVTAALLMAAVVVLGQNKSAGVNLSLWNKIATQPLNNKQKTFLNLGVQSKQNRLQGLSINLIGSSTLDSAKGIQLGGWSTMTGDNSYGVNVAGLLTVNAIHTYGLTAGGLASIVGESQHGVVVAGLFNFIGIDNKGVAIAGLGNLGGYNSLGITLGGLANIYGEDVIGITIAGLFNSSESIRGVGFAGLVNTTDQVRGFTFAPINRNTQNYWGLQAGVLNINRENFKGAQIGLINSSVHHHGLQLGVINYYKEQMKGVQLGLVNIHKNTIYDLLLYGGNHTKMNFALRFKNNLFYNIVGVGAPFLQFKDKFSGALNYRTGIHIPLGHFIDLSSDIGFSHINTFQSRQKDIPKRMYALEYRLSTEYIPSSKWSLILTGGYHTTRRYSQSSTYKKGFIIEAGIAHRLSFK